MADTQGLMIHAVVHTADIQDRDDGLLGLSTMFGLYPFLTKVFADGGYQGPKFRGALQKMLPDLTLPSCGSSPLSAIALRAISSDDTGSVDSRMGGPAPRADLTHRKERGSRGSRTLGPHILARVVRLEDAQRRLDVLCQVCPLLGDLAVENGD